jgi:RND superfamily putative drug exporter
LPPPAAVARGQPDLRIAEVGDASLDVAIGDQVSSDFSRAEKLSLPITLVILLLTFGALIAAGVPVVLALSAVAAAIGLSALVSHVTPVTDTLNSVILLIGMAVGVDYSLFYVRRAREERDRGASRVDAIETAARTSWSSRRGLRPRRLHRDVRAAALRRAQPSPRWPSARCSSSRWPCSAR